MDNVSIVHASPGIVSEVPPSTSTISCAGRSLISFRVCTTASATAPLVVRRVAAALFSFGLSVRFVGSTWFSLARPTAVLGWIRPYVERGVRHARLRCPAWRGRASGAACPRVIQYGPESAFNNYGVFWSCSYVGNYERMVRTGDALRQWWWWL